MTFSVCMRAVKPCVSSWSLDSETPGCLNANLVAAMGEKKMLPGICSDSRLM